MQLQKPSDERMDLGILSRVQAAEVLALLRGERRCLRCAMLFDSVFMALPFRFGVSKSARDTRPDCSIQTAQ